jgi:hypothetical protein
MGLSSTVNAAYYTGDGATKIFAYPFKILQDEDLKVIVRNTTTDVETELTLGTDYTVSGVLADSGGNVTLANADEAWSDGDSDLLSDYVISIARVLDLTQETDLKNLGAYYPEVVEEAFDIETMKAQQLQTQIQRALRFPETVNPDDFDTTLPPGLVGTPGATFVVNDDGDGLAQGPTLDELNGVAQDAEDAEAAAAAADAAQNAAEAAQLAAQAAQTAAEDALTDALAAQAAAEAAAAALVTFPQWAKVTIGYAALAAAALTNDVLLGISIPTRGVLEGLVIKHTTAFAGGAVSAVKIDIGVAGELDRFLSDFDVFQAVNDAASEFVGQASLGSFSAPLALRIRATAVGANLDQISQGSIDVWYKFATLPA